MKDNSAQFKAHLLQKRRAVVHKLCFIGEASAKRRAPHKTSRFRDSITTEMHPTDAVGRYGTNISDPPYPFFLEFGTRFITPRPTFRNSLEDVRKAASTWKH